ncbi:MULTISPECIES: ArsR/SmtB family transcription factor [Streptosporangium]|uniref:DNA-binding transcriptional ArsR family regulator n=1 Tax=Streptosporangium brasiliense TaxID=47480 RepID=A0ABT9RJZ1_9ACTN|nr:helix-turn-helix domain-containing protein [Streptosporangium brasiliense]MDP9869622.1 DNA-binding transcriptional ArsR family regulator [Streptosporangium brasiliense]
MTGGTLRIVFTAEDLARVRIASRADPMWEMVMSLCRLQERGGGTAMTGWRRRVRDDLASAGLLPRVREVLLPLVPKGAYFPDFLTPIEAQSGLQAGIDALAGTPRARVRAELDVLRGHAGLPSTLEDLARGDLCSVRRLSRLVDGYCRTAFASHQQMMEAALGHERGSLVRHLADDGVDTMLARLAPVLRWRPPVLEAAYPAGDREIRLHGRGLTVIPSYFCQITPVALVDQRLPPVLVYPAPRRPRPAPGHKDPLVDLLGATRATVLHTIAADQGCSTSELARRIGASLSNASKHAQVLHHAGLITSTRHANLVLHQLSDLGAGLLRRHRAQHPPG